jgi:hypothetical protein
LARFVQSPFSASKYLNPIIPNGFQPVEDAMLAFVTNPTASWMSIMSSTDSRENDRAQNLLPAAAADELDPVATERIAFFGSSRTEQASATRTDRHSGFLTLLLRALSAPSA